MHANMHMHTHENILEQKQAQVEKGGVHVRHTHIHSTHNYTHAPKRCMHVHCTCMCQDRVKHVGSEHYQFCGGAITAEYIEYERMTAAATQTGPPPSVALKWQQTR